MKKLKVIARVEPRYKKNKDMNYMTKDLLKNNLDKLDKHQFKLFYSILVHYCVNYKYFINEHTLFNLWCELNELCHEADESFPEPHDDHNLMKSYCQEHPYYFINILDIELIQKLFYQHLDKDLGTITVAIEKLHTGDLRAAYGYINEAMSLSENIDELVKDTEEYIKHFS